MAKNTTFQENQPVQTSHLSRQPKQHSLTDFIKHLTRKKAKKNRKKTKKQEEKETKKLT